MRGGRAGGGGGGGGGGWLISCGQLHSSRGVQAISFLVVVADTDVSMSLAYK